MTASAQRTRVGHRTQPSLVEQSDVRRRVRYLVHCLVEETSLEDEVCQEALVHLWKCESLTPGQPVNYYLRHCLFCIQNLLRAGRSVHSLRHRSALSLIEDHLEDTGLARIQALASDEQILQQVSARDSLLQLFPLLQPLEKRILVLLLRGHHVCEIARRLRVSHATVTRHRARIAASAVSIGFSPEVGFEPPIRIATQ